MLQKTASNNATFVKNWNTLEYEITVQTVSSLPESRSVREPTIFLTSMPILVIYMAIRNQSCANETVFDAEQL